ncbi:MAG: ABC transporter permease [Negativicutes bacterium]|nr:ABC transporter permease [Negativicutes bacterium]
MKAVFQREVKSYYDGVLGYIFTAFLLLFAGIYTMVINLNASYANFEYVLGNMTFIFLVITPILSMRVIAEEKRQKTDQLLYSLPVSMTKIVLAKYLAMLFVLAVPTVIIGFYPLILSLYGSVNLLASYGTLLAFFLLGAALLAIGLFISSLTENQAFAAALCFLVLLLNYFLADLVAYLPATAGASFAAATAAVLLLATIVRYLTKSSLSAVLLAILGEGALLLMKQFSAASMENLLPTVFGNLSLFQRFYVFPNGLFDLTALVYFLMVVLVFVFFTVQSMEKRRWS